MSGMEIASAQTAAPDTEKAMAELMKNLGKAGITAETGLTSIAAWFAAGAYTNSQAGLSRMSRRAVSRYRAAP